MELTENEKKLVLNIVQDEKALYGFMAGEKIFVCYVMRMLVAAVKFNARREMIYNSLGEKAKAFECSLMADASDELLNKIIDNL